MKRVNRRRKKKLGVHKGRAKGEKKGRNHSGISLMTFNAAVQDKFNNGTLISNLQHADISYTF